MLDEVKKGTPDFTKVLFVTSGLKENWWEKVGKKFLGPRPGLRFEIQRAGARRISYVYTFLKDEVLSLRVLTDNQRSRIL